MQTFLGWKIKIEEISANVYRVTATDKQGRIVEKDGVDIDELVNSCKEYIKSIESKCKDVK
jgi:hypothetical protein